MKVLYIGDRKCVRSDEYNYIFNPNTGFFARWGATTEDDPQFAPFPEILDIEVTTKCDGPGGKLCKFCYKANTPTGENMSLETFKGIIDKMKPTDDCLGITQVAIGADAHCTSNPDLWDMMRYCRESKIIPNITVADISDETADNLAELCGAVAVSRYDDKDLCYNSIQKLVSRGMDQVNIHQMISNETFEQAKETIRDYNEDERMQGMNAIVFLSLKKKGRGVNHTPLTVEQFKELVDMALDANVPIGFDSCGAHKFLESVKDHELYDDFVVHAEPCESTLFSSYINTAGEFFPCSFIEGIEGWEEGISVVDAEDFHKDIWLNERTHEFRCELLECGRNCPKFEV